MYRLVFILALFFAAMTPARAAPETSLTGDAAWNEYNKLLENYYFLDKQKAGHITCSVSVPSLQGYVDNVRQKAGDKVTVDENLHDFSVTYDHTKGVSFNSPHIKLSLLSDVKFSDHEQAENWRKGLEKLLNENIDYIKEITDILLTDMTYPSPEKQKNLSLTKNKDITVVSIDEDGSKHIKIVYSGTTKERTEFSSIFNETSTLNYQPLNGKLALAHLAGKRTEGSTKTNIAESISYQDVEAAFFPAQILVDATTSNDTEQHKPQHFEIDFKDCKTNDLSP